MERAHEWEKVNLLASTLKDFVEFINDTFHAKYPTVSSSDKLFRLKLLTEEYQLKTIASELLRLNNESLEEQQTRVLISRFSIALGHILEYVENNLSDLFIFSGRVYTLHQYCQLFDRANEKG